MPRPNPIPTAAVLLALLAVPAWGQSGLLRGVVQDGDGKPVAGVKITVTSEELTTYRKSMTTDKRGSFTLRFQPMQAQYQFDLLFEKAGYEAFTQRINPSAMSEVREIYIMEPAETRAIERHGDLSAVVTGSTSAAVDAFNAGLSAQREGDLATARARLEEALAGDPELAPAQIALAQVLLDQGEHAAALARAERALELSPGRVEALRVQYQVLRALGERERAEAVGLALEQAEDAVASARRVYNEGSEAFQAGDREAALELFRRAAGLDPALTDAHHAIATLELAAGNHEAAAAAAEKALALGTEDVRTLRVLYDAYSALGRNEELAQIVPRLAAVDPDFGGPKLIERAAELWNAGEAATAVALARQALAVDDGLAKAYYFIGLDHLSRGENAPARAALERFIELAPDDAEAPTAREMLTYIE